MMLFFFGWKKVTNTFNIPGVDKYCFMLKQLSDARNIRQRLLECFERASNPYIEKEERDRLLHFVVVGGVKQEQAKILVFLCFVHHLFWTKKGTYFN